MKLNYKHWFKCQCGNTLNGARTTRYHLVYGDVCIIYNTIFTYTTSH